jgi:hypothetical protein
VSLLLRNSAYSSAWRFQLIPKARVERAAAMTSSGQSHVGVADFIEIGRCTSLVGLTSEGCKSPLAYSVSEAAGYES